MTNSSSEQKIAEIPDQYAVQVLALLLDHERRLPDPETARDLSARIAIADPEPTIDDDTPTDNNTEAGTAVSPSSEPSMVGSPYASEADLARAGITHLLHAQPDLVPLLPRALTMVTESSSATRFDPITLGVAGLVLLALQTDIDWIRTATGRWHIRVHKRGLGDTAVVNLVRAALGQAQRPEPTDQPN